MNLIFDIGNSFVKISLFKEGEEIFFQKYTEFTENDLGKIISTFGSIRNVIITTVREHDIIIHLKQKFKNNILVNETTPLPVKIHYDTPETLGYDRIAACVGAHFLFPGENILIIDAGTAITFDFINKEGYFEGGNISPGLATRFKALHQYTGKLPLVSSDEPFSLTGKSTKQAISGGVWFGMIYEIQGYINSYQSRYGQLKIVLTGGDGNNFMEKLKNNINHNSDTIYFVEKLKNSIFVVLNLNMLGLNRILEYNVS